jgi:hypothetical protein
MLPQALQVCPQSQDLRALGVGRSRRLVLTCNVELFFKTRNLRKPFIPAPFEISGNQTVRRINGIILSVRASRFIARLFQRQLDLLQPLRAVALAIGDRLQGSVEAK